MRSIYLGLKKKQAQSKLGAFLKHGTMKWGATSCKMFPYYKNNLCKGKHGESWCTKSQVDDSNEDNVPNEVVNETHCVDA